MVGACLRLSNFSAFREFSASATRRSTGAADGLNNMPMDVSSIGQIDLIAKSNQLQVQFDARSQFHRIG